MAWAKAEPLASKDALVKMPKSCAAKIPSLTLSVRPQSSAFTISRFIDSRRLLAA